MTSPGGPGDSPDLMSSAARLGSRRSISASEKPSATSRVRMRCVIMNCTAAPATAVVGFASGIGNGNCPAEGEASRASASVINSSCSSMRCRSKALSARIRISCARSSAGSSGTFMPVMPIHCRQASTFCARESSSFSSFFNPSSRVAVSIVSAIVSPLARFSPLQIASTFCRRVVRRAGDWSRDCMTGAADRKTDEGA